MRDYGSATDIYGRLREDAPNYQEIKHTQVYTATHKGEGASSRLPFMNRSFISFSFGGKYIEDFGLIATIDGDRLQRRGYAEFEDLVSEYEVLDGHFYWGTHHTNHELEFNLATDAITQVELDKFLHWFSPGKTRELILAEHPNRAVQARVSAPPDLHLLPFEEKTTKMIDKQAYTTSTTLYKGEITLVFTMEEPYWYSKVNIFGYFDGQVYHDVWIDANGKEVDIFKDPDAIKIALEDNIPIASMIQNSMLLGDNTYANSDKADGAMTAGISGGEGTTGYEATTDIPITLADEVWSCQVIEPTTYTTCNPSVAAVPDTLPSELIAVTDNFTCKIILTTDDALNMFTIAYDYGDGNYVTSITGIWQKTSDELITLQPKTGDIYVEITDGEEQIPEQSRIAVTTIRGGQEVWLYGARIGGTIMSESTGIEDFSADSVEYFYYAGNAPSKPIVQFTLTPIVNTDGFISSPKNSYTSTTPYNVFSFESLNKKELQFTTPSVYTGYNQAIKIFQDAAATAAWVDVRKLIRDYVNHPAARAWANKVIDSFEESTVSNLNGYAVNRMKYFLLNEKGQPLNATFEIDSKTGRAIGKIQYRVADESEITDWSTYAVLKDENEGITDPYYQMTHEEDVGDMIRSNYLIIEDQNQPTADGYIVAWSGENEENRLHAHVIRHDVVNGLHNVFIKYNNMYL